jgi:ferredoxin
MTITLTDIAYVDYKRGSLTASQHWQNSLYLFLKQKMVVEQVAFQDIAMHHLFSDQRFLKLKLNHKKHDKSKDVATMMNEFVSSSADNATDGEGDAAEDVTDEDSETNSEDVNGAAKCDKRQANVTDVARANAVASNDQPAKQEAENEMDDVNEERKILDDNAAKRSDKRVEKAKQDLHKKVYYYNQYKEVINVALFPLLMRYCKINTDINDQQQLEYFQSIFPEHTAGRELPLSTFRVWRDKYHIYVEQQNAKKEKAKTEAILATTVGVIEKKRGPKVNTRLGLKEGELSAYRRYIYGTKAQYIELAALLWSQSECGVPMNSTTVYRFARIVFGNQVSPSSAFCFQLIKKMGLSWRAATGKKRKTGDDFESTKHLFFLRYLLLVTRGNIAPEMIIAMDESGVVLFPTTDKTYKPIGSNSVQISGHDEKRQVTATYAISLTGIITPVQTIFQGTTDNCHPKTTSLNIRNVHSASHWCTKETVLTFFEMLHAEYILPQARKRVDLSDASTVPWLFIWDVYCTHIDKEVLQTLKQLYPSMHILYIPPGYTGELSPLDLLFNAVIKKSLRHECGIWLEKYVLEYMKNGKDPKDLDLKNELKMSSLKEKFVQWHDSAIEGFKSSKGKEIIKNSFKRSCQSVENPYGLLLPFITESVSPKHAELTKTLVKEAEKLEGEGKLWQFSNKKELPQSSLCPDGAIQLKQDQKEQEEQEIEEYPNDNALLGEDEEADQDDDDQPLQSPEENLKEKVAKETEFDIKEIEDDETTYPKSIDISVQSHESDDEHDTNHDNVMACAACKQTKVSQNKLYRRINPTKNFLTYNFRCIYVCRKCHAEPLESFKHLLSTAENLLERKELTEVLSETEVSLIQKIASKRVRVPKKNFWGGHK